MQNHDLLERIHEMVGCEFLSDLKQIHNQEKVLDALGQIKESDYPVRQWEKALSYLFSEDVKVQSMEDIYRLRAEKSVSGLDAGDSL